jgi:hypothetical protein
MKDGAQVCPGNNVKSRGAAKKDLTKQNDGQKRTYRRRDSKNAEVP